MNHFSIDDQGHVISYMEYGNPKGFPILIQHGLIASIKDYGIFNPLTENGVRLICIARPGYGESSAFRMENLGVWGSLVARLVDRLDLPCCDVLGMSSGAPYSYAIGNALKQRVRNLYIYSGIPAMYDDQVLACWPNPVDRSADFDEMLKLAWGLFFSNLSADDRNRNDTQDSMANGGFGIAQDFYLRCRDWGFDLGDLEQAVFMRHARFDPGVPLSCVELTAKKLRHCSLEIEKNDIHFSQPSLNVFLLTRVLPQIQ